MAPTFVLINSTTLSAATTSVTFSSIPQTYDDLLVRYIVRTDYVGTYVDEYMRINNISTSVYEWLRFSGNGATASGTYANGNTSNYAGTMVSDTSSANVFAAKDIYIPAYTSTIYEKPFLNNVAPAVPASTTLVQTFAGMVGTSSGISSIQFLSNGSGTTINYVAGSKFYLYGIKNS